MSKGTIFIGFGILAIGGLAYWYFSKPSAGETSDVSSADSGIAPLMDSSFPQAGIGTQGASNSRKQVRRDCRAEAKAQGLRGREKRQFKKACKASGGINADTADFAFNGFDGAFEFA